MVLFILAGNFDPLIFVGVMPLGTYENIRKSTNNLSFLCQFFINEITASDAGPDIIRSRLLHLNPTLYNLFNPYLYFTIFYDENNVIF